MALSCEFEILELFGFGDGKERHFEPSRRRPFLGHTSKWHEQGLAGTGVLGPEEQEMGPGTYASSLFYPAYNLWTLVETSCELKATKDDMSDLEINLDRSKILSHGRPAVEDYLQKLHVYKSTADFEAGKKLYDDITSVDEWWAEKVRPVVLSKKTPRKVFVQANTVLDAKSGEVSLVEYEPTIEGMVKSYVERDV